MKQYLLLCEEKDIEGIKGCSGGRIQFLEVQGKPLTEPAGFAAIITQMPAPTTPLTPQVPQC
jgi:hypothetical protein